MKQKLKLLLSITIMLFIFKSCKPDEKCVDGNTYKYIDDYDYSKIPYKDNSKLSFIDKKTKDTLIFTGQGFQYGFGKYVAQGECPQTTNLEYRSLTLMNNRNADAILVENKFVSFDVSYIGITYKNYSKSFSPVEVSKPYKYDSLIIQGVKYYNVQYLKDTHPYTPFLSIYYHLNYGILKLETNKGDTLELIKLEL
jgi:hypothetical protein